MRKRDGIADDAKRKIASDRDVVREYELLRYQQIKEKYEKYGSVTRQLGNEK